MPLGRPVASQVNCVVGTLLKMETCFPRMSKIFKFESLFLFFNEILVFEKKDWEQ